jgi:transcriptional regulator with XRE-family HTH domain
MNLQKQVIERIKGRSDIKRSLISALGVSRYSIWKYLKDNEDDGPLTTYKALQIISKGLEITPEEAMCEEAKEKEVA